MPNFRCEYKVTCDLVLGDETGSYSITGLDGAEYQFSNADKDEDGHTPYLVVTVIGEASTIEQAENQLRECLAKQLDLITFATHSRCRIEEPIRLVEWEPGEKERNFRIFHVSDPRYPPEPNLTLDFLCTSSILDNAIPASYVRTALKYFRYGVIDEKPEDQ